MKNSSVRFVLTAAALFWLALVPPSGLARAADFSPTQEELRVALQRVDAYFPYLVRKRDARTGEVELGRRLFFDPRLSRSGAMSCASCHRPEKAMSDGLPRAVGRDHKVLRRNTPTIAGGRYRKFFFWDGRASSIETAALTAIQNPEEMNQDLPGLMSKLAAVSDYVSGFARVYGSSGLTHDNAASALAAFVERQPTFKSAFDDFHERGVPMDPAAQRGLVLFTGKAGCVRCHASSNFTSERFLNIGLRKGEPEDLGRYAVTGKAEDRGAFRVPSLRNAAITAPYMHDGSLKSLREVVDFFDRGGDARPAGREPVLEPLGLEESEKADLTSFLEALASPPRPAAPSRRSSDSVSAPADNSLADWDRLALSIDRVIIEEERAASWSALLPPSGFGNKRACLEKLGMDALLRKAVQERWREKDEMFVEGIFTVMAGRHALFLALAEENPARCAALAAVDSTARDERASLEGACRERYYEMRFAQAVAAGNPERQRGCVESLSHQPSLGLADARVLCTGFMQNLDNPAKGCALAVPAYLDAHQVSACENGMKIYMGDAATCENIADLAEHLPERCETFPLYRRASLARNIELCGSSLPCRALMGAGKEAAAIIARSLTARACGLASLPPANGVPAALERDLDRAQRLLERIPESRRERRIQRLASWRRRQAALSAPGRATP